MTKSIKHVSLKWLQHNVHIRNTTTPGHWVIKVFKRGKVLDTFTTNSLAVDRARDTDNGRDMSKLYITRKQAYFALYTECLRDNAQKS